MSKFIRTTGGDLQATESLNKLQDLASTRRCSIDMENTDIENIIAQTHTLNIELMHVIRTEDKIDNIKCKLSDEMKVYTKNVSKEFMENVLDPFCKSVITFMEKHPEYVIKGLTINSEVESGKSIALRELKETLMEMMR